MPNWGVEHLQLSLVAKIDNDLDVAGLFETLFGMKPAKTHFNRPEEGPGGVAVYDDGKFFRYFSVISGRQDVMIKPTAHRRDLMAPPLFASDLGELSAPAMSAFKLLTIGASEISRVAAMSRFVGYHKDLRSANMAISRVAPLSKRLTTETDFALRINTPDEIEAVRVNKVSKWSVDGIRLDLPNVQSGARPMNAFFRSVIDMDWNTVGADEIQAFKIVERMISGLQNYWDRSLAN